jgi:hypothetical protein
MEIELCSWRSGVNEPLRATNPDTCAAVRASLNKYPTRRGMLFDFEFVDTGSKNVFSISPVQFARDEG